MYSIVSGKLLNYFVSSGVQMKKGFQVSAHEPENTNASAKCHKVHRPVEHFVYVLTLYVFRVNMYPKGRELQMPLKPREMEKIILADGWLFKGQEGSHRSYIHPTKPGKVTIPFHPGDLNKKVENSIRKQAGLK